MLPRTYQRWLGDWLAGDIPEEKVATCDNCAMAAPPGTPQTTSAMAEYYGPNKCCTYFPALPNFQVGGILKDDRIPEGASRVAEVIRGRVGVDPICVRPNKRRTELYKIGSRVAFGRAEAFRCPYYMVDSGGCSVWPHREAVCSTFYCKVNRPLQGRPFWEELKELLVQIEQSVSVHCALELGISGGVIDELMTAPYMMKSAADVDAVPDDEQHAKLWGKWLGREDAYYRACAEQAEQLDFAAVRKLGGITLERRLAMVRKAFDALLSTALPARLKVGPLQLAPAKPGKVRLVAGANQPLEMRAMVIEVLSYFQGQPLDEVKATLVEQGFELADSFIEKLWSHGFLVEATE
jgi:hypothetical protein